MKLSISLDRFNKASTAELSIFDTETQVLKISKDACWKAGEEIKIDRNSVRLEGTYKSKSGSRIKINGWPKWDTEKKAFMIEGTRGSWPMSPKHFIGRASWSFDLGCSHYVTISRKCLDGEWGIWEVSDSER